MMVRNGCGVGRAAHWFTVYGEPGHVSPYCVRCKAPNPRWNAEKMLAQYGGLICCTRHAKFFVVEVR